MSTQNLKWQDTLPTEKGWYWFYGELHMGGMGRDYFDDYIHTPEMTIVNVHPTMITAEGHFVSRNKFDKEKRKSGWLGYWAKATLPESPHDGNSYFNSPVEAK